MLSISVTNKNSPSLTLSLSVSCMQKALYCVRELKINPAKVNVNGGAIALGHPLGATGARQLATLVYEMKRNPSARYGVVSMCIGTGMGAAAVFEAER